MPTFYFEVLFFDITEVTPKSFSIPLMSNYLLVTALSGVSYASVYEQTHSSVVTYLFHDGERKMWLFCLVWRVRRAYVGLRWSKYSTHSTVCASGVLLRSARVSALFEGLTEFCFVIRFDFCATSPDFTPRIELAVTLLLLLRRCMKSFRAFLVANTVAHAYRQRVCVCRSFRDAPCLLGRSAVRAQRWLLQRLLGLFVARCALVRNSLQASVLSAEVVRAACWPPP